MGLGALLEDLLVFACYIREALNPKFRGAKALCPKPQVGLGVLLASPPVFACYADMHDTVWHSELGASLAILNAGFNLDSLMTRFRGVDWRDRRFWNCNAGCAVKQTGLCDSSLSLRV